MEFVIDANIVIAALLSAGKTKEMLFRNNLKLYSPEFLVEEINRHMEELLFKSRMPEESFRVSILLILSRIKIMPFSDYSDCIKNAEAECPDECDIDYIALALKLNCPLWSNDKELKNNMLIKVYSTDELVKTFGM